jgi:uncharacterized membrane protein YphA (DoxX/SURF4 family)
MSSDSIRLPGTLAWALLVLRILVGWHFLYEGVAKLLNPNWSSAGYLVESTWIFSGLFRWMASVPAALKAVDYLNMWGLTLIGAALFLGVLPRVASAFGLALLALYYMALPPFIGLESPGAATEGSYLIVNKNVIEMGVLALFILLPKASLPGLDLLLRKLKPAVQSRVKIPELRAAAEENQVDRSLTGLLERRRLLLSLASLPVLGVFVVEVLRKKSYEELRLKSIRGVDAVTSASMKAVRFARLADLKGQVPRGKIGGVEISRIVVGGNLISGFAHSRDLIYVSPFLRTYFTDEKVIETLRLCEACGINTAILRTDENTIRILNQYRRLGGRIQWLAQVYPKADDLTSNIQMAVDNGAIGAFVMGGIADQFVHQGRLDLLEKAIAFIRSKGIIGGTAAHTLRLPMECETAGLEFDFYMKTLHDDGYWSAHPVGNRVDYDIVGQNRPEHDHFHDNLWCTNPVETADYMNGVKKPWIAYKVLAAGAIHPKDGFRFAFQHGADFACVGMFDFQVVENANIACEVLGGDLKRSRLWYA